MNRSVTLALAVTTSLLIARSAAADTRSWTAVKKVIGKGDTTVVGIDLARLRTTGAFQAGLQLMLSSEEEAKQVFDTVKSSCGFDMLAVVSDLTIVMQDGDDNPLIAFGLDGVDEAKVVSCMGSVAGAMTGMPSPKLTGKKIGKLTEYSVKGEKKKLYAAWLAKDVLVFTDDANDKAKLTKRLAGKGATGDLARFIGKTSPASPFWFAVAKKDKEDGRTILGGSAKVDLTAGVFKAAGALVMSKPNEASELVTEAVAGLAEVKKEIGAKSPEMGRALTTMVIAAVGADVQISGAISDTDLATLIPQLDKLF